MRRLSRGLPLLLATLIALRALVPVGFMLSAPDGESGTPVLQLCPLQNPGLNLSALATHDVVQHASDHHGSEGPAAPAPVAPVASANDCSLWLASSITALTDGVPGPSDIFPADYLAPYQPGRLVRLPAHTLQAARAPPALPI